MERELSFLGNQLIKLGKITEEQLQMLSATEEAEDHGNKGMLGQILVDMACCTQEDVAQAMAKNPAQFSFEQLSHRHACNESDFA